MPTLVSVAEIMTQMLETAKVSDTAQEAAKKMTNKNVSSLAVVFEDGTPAGIVTESDLVRHVCATDKPSSRTKVQEIMSSPVKTVSASTSIGEAADSMVRNKVRHLIVVDTKDGHVLGILTATDIVAFVRENGEVMMQADKDVIRVLEREGRFYF